MSPILEKVYANALLFSVGLLLGNATESPERAPKSTQQAPEPDSRPTTPAERRAGTPATGRSAAESEELALLRRAEAELFGDRDDLSGDSLSMPSAGEVPMACAPRDRRSGSTLASPADGIAEESTDFWAGLQMPALQVRQDPRVEKYIRYFTQNKDGRGTFIAWLRRSGRYRSIIFDILRENGLPQDLIAVVFIESGFGPTAVSSAGAAGLWQFMPRTGRAYGLTVDRRYDERRGIWRSTAAAARHLADLYEYFRSWDLALAAYNYGHQRLTDLTEQMATDDYWALSRIEGALPRETALYVPKVLAVAVLLNNLDRFGFGDVKPDTAIDATPMEVPPGVRLSMLARAAGTSLEKIRAWNPEFRRDMTPDLGGAVLVHLPSDGLARARVMLPRLMDDSERDTRDLEVPANFDWGRDDLGGGAQRLAGTVSPGRRGSSSAAGVPDRPAASDRYFGRLTQTEPATRLQGTVATDAADDSDDATQSLDTKSMSGDPTQKATIKDESVQRPAKASATAPRKKRAKADRPRARAPRAAATKVVFYMASENETAQSIARTFGVRASDVLQENRLGPADSIHAGTLLRIPVAARALRGLEGRNRDGGGKAAR